MSTSKISIKHGNFEFYCEGQEEWLTSQLDKILIKLPELPRPPANLPKGQRDESPRDPVDNTVSPGALASFLKAKGVASNQTQKFLATACWLRLKGTTRFSTADITKALKDNHQGRLSNPAQFMNENIGKGHCERDGETCYVTPEGLASLAVEVSAA